VSLNKIVGREVYTGLRRGTWELEPLARVADLPGRRSLRSASTSRLLVSPVRLSTFNSRTIMVAGPRACRGDDISTATDNFFSTSKNLALQTILGLLGSHNLIYHFSNYLLNCLNFEIVLLLRHCN